MHFKIHPGTSHRNAPIFRHHHSTTISRRENVLRAQAPGNPEPLNSNPKARCAHAFRLPYAQHTASPP